MKHIETSPLVNPAFTKLRNTCSAKGHNTTKQGITHMRSTMKSIFIYTSACFLAGFSPCYAQSVDAVFASGFETICAAPNYQGVPINLMSQMPFSTFMLSPFPGVLNTAVTSPLLLANQALAYEFVAPAQSATSAGYLQTISNLGTVVTSISECPGEFGDQLQACNGGVGKSRVDWLASDAPSGSPLCVLIPGRIYYFNIGMLACGASDCTSRTISRRFL